MQVLMTARQGGRGRVFDRVNKSGAIVISTIKFRVRWLTTEAHVDLLEIVVFGALINLGSTVMQLVSGDIWPPLYKFLWSLAPRPVWATLVFLLAFCELFGALTNRKKLRAWINFGSAITFFGIWLSVWRASNYSIAWKDYILFMLCAAASHLRLRHEYTVEQVRRGRTECSTSKTGVK